MVDNPFEDLLRRLNSLAQLQIKCGTVTSTSPFKAKFDGEAAELQYLRPSTYTPTVGDRVYFLCADGKYVCLGKYV